METTWLNIPVAGQHFSAAFELHLPVTSASNAVLQRSSSKKGINNFWRVDKRKFFCFPRKRISSRFCITKNCNKSYKPMVLVGPLKWSLNAHISKKNAHSKLVLTQRRVGPWAQRLTLSYRQVHNQSSATVIQLSLITQHKQVLWLKNMHSTKRDFPQGGFFISKQSSNITYVLRLKLC